MQPEKCDQLPGMIEALGDMTYDSGGDSNLVQETFLDALKVDISN